MTTLDQRIKEFPQTSIFANLVLDSSIQNILSLSGPYTLFVPANQALEDKTVFFQYLKEKNIQTEYAANYIVIGYYLLSDLRKIDEIANLNNSYLPVSLNNSVKISGANILEGDLIAKNGVIHLLDSLFSL